MASLLDEVRQVTSFLVTQRPILGDNLHAILQGQCDQLGRRIETDVGITDSDMLNEIGTVIQSGPWTNAQKNSLALALTNRLQGDPVGHNRQQQQDLVNGFQTYFTKDPLAQLQSEGVQVRDKLMIGATVNASIGLVNPSEKTYKHQMQIMVYLGFPDMARDSATMFNLLRTFKELMKQKRLSKKIWFPFDRISHYPGNPYQLPND
eukprot:3253333-Karenia_brevis.AAC.2